MRRRYLSGEQDEAPVVPSHVFPYTLIAYVDDPVVLVSSEENFYIGWLDSSQPDRLVGLGSTASSGWRYFYRKDLDPSFTQITGGTQALGAHLLIGTTRGSEDHEFFVDGVSVGTNTTLMKLFTPDKFALGRLPDSSPTSSTNSGIIYAAFMPAGFSSAEAQKLYRDPSGPFRMWDEAGVVYAVGGGNPKGPFGHPLWGPFAGPLAA